MIRTPALCRLCRRPLPRGTARCPYCGARLAWRDRARREPGRGWGTGWRISGFVIALAVLAAAVVAGVTVVREIKRPLTSADEGLAPGRPSPKECAEAIAELANPRSDTRVSAETRARLRQCFEKK